MIQVVDGRVSSLRHELNTMNTTLASDVSCMAKDAVLLRADVSTIANLAKKIDADMACLEPRVSRLEANEFTPKASLRLVQALEDKVENILTQQVCGSCMMHHTLIMLP